MENKQKTIKKIILTPSQLANANLPIGDIRDQFRTLGIKPDSKQTYAIVDADIIDCLYILISALDLILKGDTPFNKVKDDQKLFNMINHIKEHKNNNEI